MTVLGKRVEISLDKILFATDFSPAAERAGLYAKALARRYGAKVQIVHVVDFSAACQIPDAGAWIDRFRQVGGSELEKVRPQFASGGTKVETTLSEGMDPALEILQLAKRESSDLLVIGTRGRNGLARLVFGSVAEQLIHRATCPVLTAGAEVRPPEPTGSFQRIVYATDFSSAATKAAPFAFSFAQENGAHVYLCHVLPEAGNHHPVDDQELTVKYTAALRHMIPEITREWCEPECVVEHGYAADGILLLSDRVKADLIVLGARSFSHWFDSVKPGIAYEVIGAATCPVLTVRG
jgi:nucleotide-binding universal stress UspA family protein